MASLGRRHLAGEQAQAVHIREEEPAVASFCTHWSLADTRTPSKVLPLLVSLAYMGNGFANLLWVRSLAIFVTAMAMSTIYSHSELYHSELSVFYNWCSKILRAYTTTAWL